MNESSNNDNNPSHTEGSQSKPVVLASTLFIAALSVACLVIAAQGPDSKSVFFFFRHGVFFYPLMIVGALLFARITWLGFKRLKTL